jgi:predicted phage-related endonuclease
MTHEPKVSQMGQVPLAAADREIDLSRSNSIHVLLEEWRRLSVIRKTTQDRITEIETIVKGIMREAETGTLPGWTISFQTIRRREHLVLAGEYKRLIIREA